MSAKAARPSASLTTQKMSTVPGGIAAGTVTRSENVRSPGVTSPFVPSSDSRVMPPPSGPRLQATPMPVLGGLSAGVTVTVRSVEPPAGTLAGVAAPTAVIPAAVAAGTKMTAISTVIAAASNLVATRSPSLCD